MYQQLNLSKIRENKNGYKHTLKEPIHNTIGKKSRLWLLLTLSAIAHTYLLGVFYFFEWPIIPTSTPSKVLKIRLIGTHPTNISKTINKSSLFSQNTEHRPHSQQTVKHTNQNPFDKSQLPSIEVDSGPSISTPYSSPPPASLDHESSTLQSDSDKVNLSNTISAAALIENSVAMIHQDPFLGSDEETNFNKYELMKRINQIRQILPALVEKPTLQKKEGIKEFKTINGDTQVMITIENGDKFCFEIPSRDFMTPDVGFSSALWMFTKCKDEVKK